MRNILKILSQFILGVFERQTELFHWAEWICAPEILRRTAAAVVDGHIVLLRRKRVMKGCVYLNLLWQGHFKPKEFSSCSLMHGNGSSNDI